MLMIHQNDITQNSQLKTDLELSYNADCKRYRTGINIAVYAAPDFRIQTFVFCDYKRILNRSIYTQTHEVIEKSGPGITYRNIVTTEEACVAHEIVA